MEIESYPKFSVDAEIDLSRARVVWLEAQLRHERHRLSALTSAKGDQVELEEIFCPSWDGTAQEGLSAQRASGGTMPLMNDDFYMELQDYRGPGEDSFEM